MGRAARPQDRLPSQRERKEVRDARKEASEAARKLEIANEEKQIAHRNRNNDSKRARAAEKELKNREPPSLSGLHGEIPRLKFQSTAFYAHVEYGYQWLEQKRFHLLDVPLLISSLCCTSSDAIRRRTCARRRS